MYEDPEPVIVSLAYAAGATRVMLATSALATRIPLIFRIYFSLVSTFSQLEILLFNDLQVNYLCLPSQLEKN
jgi:hypothetical protein